jgi:hypothetical protein
MGLPYPNTHENHIFERIAKIEEYAIIRDMFSWNMARIIFFPCYFMRKPSLHGYLVHLAQIQD